MKTIGVCAISGLIICFSACQEILPESRAALKPDYSPFEVHAPARSVRITEAGKYRVDSSVVYESKNKVRLIAELEKEKLVEKKSVSEIPSFIRNFFDSLTHKKMDIVDPGQEWNSGTSEIQLFDKFGKPLNNLLPTKQLVYFGIGKNMAFFSYYVSGREKTQEMVIVKFSGEKIVDLWFNRNQALVTGRPEMIRYIKEHQTTGGC